MVQASRLWTLVARPDPIRPTSAHFPRALVRFPRALIGSRAAERNGWDVNGRLPGIYAEYSD